jgi:hypothetical protein
MMKPITIKDPVFAHPTNKEAGINLSVTFAELGANPVPFAAVPNDIEEHGRDLYMRALAGQFGPVKPCPVASDQWLTNVKTETLAEIDRLMLPSIETTDYTLALDEARRIENDKSPNPDNYPLLNEAVGYEGKDIVAVGAAVRARDLETHRQAARNSRIRRDGIDAVNKATTEDEVQAAYTKMFEQAQENVRK